MLFSKTQKKTASCKIVLQSNQKYWGFVVVGSRGVRQEQTFVLKVGDKSAP